MVSGHPHKKVLVVEDDFLLREALSLSLAAEGYMVAFAKDGREAVERLHGPELADVIVLDLRLPGMDGGELCARLRQDPRLAAIPVILCSASADLARLACELRAADFVQKPFETEDLLRAIRRQCGRKGPAPAAPPAAEDESLPALPS